MAKKVSRKQLRVIMLADEKLLPKGDLEDLSPTICPASAAPSTRINHVAFNLVEEFGGIGHFDAHVVKFPLFVKSLTEEGSAGISGASLVQDEERLKERIEFIHRNQVHSPCRTVYRRPGDLCRRDGQSKGHGIAGLGVQHDQKKRWPLDRLR
jgi:hypothetical protein